MLSWMTYRPMHETNDPGIYLWDAQQPIQQGLIASLIGHLVMPDDIDGSGHFGHLR